MAAKKRRKKNWLLLLLTLAAAVILLPLTFWIARHWFAGGVVKAPQHEDNRATAAEKISKEEREQLERIIKKREP